jgi:hypothetical protein
VVELVQLGGEGLVELGEEVPVAVEGDGDRRVAQSLLDRLRVSAEIYIVRLDPAEGVTRLDSHLETRPRGSSNAGGPAGVETGDPVVVATGARPPAQRRQRRARLDQSSLFDDQQGTA